MLERKLKLALVAMILIMTCGLLILTSPLFLQVLDAMITGLVSVFAIYCTGNVVNKYAVGKVLAQNPGLSGEPLENLPKTEEE